MSELDDWLAREGKDYIDGLRRRPASAALGVKPARRRTPERDLQRAIVALARRAFPSVLVAAVPNEQRAAGQSEGQRLRFGAARKASGVVSGFPDLIVCGPVGGIEFWELKAPAGRVSQAQSLVHLRLMEQGHTVRIIRDLDDAATYLRGLAARG